MAEALWSREPLELRKLWKQLIVRHNGGHEPIWEDTIEIYRAVLYLRLLNNEPLHAAAPARLPALHFDAVHGVPACNYGTLPAATKRELRTRISTRRAQLKLQAQAQTDARRTTSLPSRQPRLREFNSVDRQQIHSFYFRTPPLQYQNDQEKHTLLIPIPIMFKLLRAPPVFSSCASAVTRHALQHRANNRIPHSGSRAVSRAGPGSRS